MTDQPGFGPWNNPGTPDADTEYGGAPGLIQPPPHEPTPSERRGILVRGAIHGHHRNEAGELVWDGVDPVTGLSALDV